MRGSSAPLVEQLRAARRKTVPDILAPGLDVVFCGINPGLCSAAVGHHFARPGNRFWKTIFRAGFTPRLLSPAEDRLLPRYGCGITNLVARPTAAADELSAGRAALEKKVCRYAPRSLAVLGVGAYRTAFGRLKAGIGLQQEAIGATRVWVLPNPSGLNAHYPLDDLVHLFAKVREATAGPRPRMQGARRSESRRGPGS